MEAKDRILDELAAVQAEMSELKRSLRQAETRLSYASVRVAKLKRRISAALRAEREEDNKSTKDNRETR